MRIVIFFLFLAITVISCYSIPDKEKPAYSLSKIQEIEAYAQYEWEITHDPATQTIPAHRLVDARESLNSRAFRGYIREQDTWMSLGPADVGGRTRAILIDANDSTGNTVFAGSVSGGLYKTTKFKSDHPDWNPVIEIAENLAIGSIIQDPQDPKIIYVGTGEGWFNGDASRGEGIYKTVDGGLTWFPLTSTLNSTFWRVNDLLIDLNGNLYASTRNQGIQKSEDGGNSWRMVLGVTSGNSNSDRGADLEIGPNGDLYATTGLFSLGSVHKADFSVNGAQTGDIISWEEITPLPDFRRIELAVAPSDGNRLYALCQDDDENTVTGMFRSNDGGMSWDSISIPYLTITSDSTNFARSQAWYNLIARVDPNDEDVLYIGGIDLHRSDDAGESWTPLSNWYFAPNQNFGEGRVVHADQHEIQFINGNSNEAIFTNDGGVYFSENLNASEPTFIPKDQGYNTTQFYSCCMSGIANELFYYGGTQDNGTWVVQGTDLDPELAFEIFGGDGGYCFIGQENPMVGAASFQYIGLFFTADDGASFSFFGLEGSRGAFINPYTIDEKHLNIYGAFENDKYFTALDPENQEELDSVLVPEFAGAQISALTLDPVVDHRLWVGVRPYFDEEWMGHAGFFRIDSAHTKEPIVTEFSDPSWSQFLAPRNIFIDELNPNFMLLTFSNFGSPNVWISKDAGKNWENIDGDLPDMPVRWGVINPLDSNEIILATELGVYHTAIPGGEDTEWLPYKSGFPKLRVNMLQVRESDQTLLAASYGRGLFATQYEASANSDVILSFNFENLIIDEHEGTAVDFATCGEPIRSVNIPVVLNRGLNADEKVTLNLNLQEGEETEENVILPKGFEVPVNVTEFDLPMLILDDGFREDRQEFVLQLTIDEGDAFINVGSLEMVINDNESNFLSLSAETEMADLGAALSTNEFTFFTTDKAVSRIELMNGDEEEKYCATVSIDGTGGEVVFPEWLFGSGYNSKTFYITSEFNRWPVQC